MTLGTEIERGSVQKLAEGLWSIHTDFFFGEGNLGNRSVIVQLAHALAIINATPVTESSVAQVRDIEAATNLKLEYILSTGDWHYLRMGEWLNHFPSAKAYIPAGRLEQKIPELDAPFPYVLLDNSVENPLPELEPHLKCQTIFGMKQHTGPEPRIEYAYLHAGSKTLISGDAFWYAEKDMIFSMYYSDNEQGRICFHFGKFTVVADKDALLTSHARILTWDFDNFIPVHGSLSMFVRGNARDKFLNSVDFLTNA
ncbi:hypothetical protein CcCBS67573_g05394 [Chytriomyces confervae]|uniref:Metallo-beta-lactamase domain-containing protein n=1 Tax=Chytriomyces confervae TaxID=246404 RepID=A0A507FAH1_9FUNG|nr:hypothetical protein CcCBS67573_g05394 [Chytriomyces confervae]